MKSAITTGFIIFSVALASCGQADDLPEPPAPVAATSDTGDALAGAAQSAPVADISVDRIVSGDWMLVPVATGFDYPWGIAFLPEGGFLVSEREGRLSYVAPGATTGQAVTGAPDTLVGGQGGYFGLVTDPDFERNRLVYLAYAKGKKSSNSTAVYKARLSPDATALQDGSDVFVARTRRATQAHYGGRLLFMPDDTLMISLGEGYSYRDDAQNPGNTHGTIIRIKTDGSIPADNPFADGVDGLAEVWSYGHRNVQGLAYDAAHETLYSMEHGPKGGDEINIEKPAANYGWPVITYGVNYDGTVITDKTEAPGMEQPVVKWVPSIAPGGLVFYTGDTYPAWKGDLLAAALAGMKIQRVDLEDGDVIGEEALFEDAGMRFRHIAQGPDGFLYVLSDEIGGTVYRIESAG